MGTSVGPQSQTGWMQTKGKNLDLRFAFLAMLKPPPWQDCLSGLPWCRRLGWASLREPLADLGRRIFNAINVPFGLEVVITQHDKLNKGQE